MSIHRFYTPSRIVNAGERRVERFLNEEFNYHPEHFIMIYPYLLPRHVTQGVGECDFLIISKYGLMILEVKGGQVKIEENRFYQKSREGWQERNSPFLQARKNKDTLIGWLKEHKIRNLPASSGVAFPECELNLPDGTTMDPFWCLGMQESLSEYIIARQISGHDFFREKLGITPALLGRSEMERLANQLCPAVMPQEALAIMRRSSEQAQQRVFDNWIILEGLRANKRLLIQGPPGSGKSRYAMRMIEAKIREGAAKVLYLCWNELLAVYMQYKFDEAGLGRAEAHALYPFVLQLMKDAGMDPETFPVTKLKEAGAMRGVLTECLAYLASQQKLPVYDYIVVDEAQDVFHQGIDYLIDSLAAPAGNGIGKGNYLLFYDNQQAYRKEHEVEEYTLTLEIFRENAAVYQLYDRYRGIGSEGLYDFIEDVQRGIFDLKKNYGADVIIKSYPNQAKLLERIRACVQEVRNQVKYDPAQLVVLFSSSLISRDEKSPKEFDLLLSADDSFVRITNENLCRPENEKIKFCTALRYKGLERDIVILAIKDLYDKKSDALHQLLIGASRARVRLYLLVDEESFKMNQERVDG